MLRGLAMLATFPVRSHQSQRHFRGASKFDTLNIAMGPRGRSADILYLDRFEKRAAALLDRKRILMELLSGIGAPICSPEPHGGDGAKLFEHACEMGWRAWSQSVRTRLIKSTSINFCLCIRLEATVNVCA